MGTLCFVPLRHSNYKLTKGIGFVQFSTFCNFSQHPWDVDALCII